MGFDLLLAGGPGNTLFPGDLLSCLVEARVEQSLDEPTRFAVRFQDDIVDGKSQKAGLPELKIGALLTIAVSKGNGDDYTCLVRGPILDHDQELTLGGPGSWFEVQGVDRRDELARDYREGAWTGRASDVARLLLSPVYPQAEIDRTDEIHDAEENPLPQRGTDLEFLKKNASENGYHFWIVYEQVVQGPAGLSLTEKAQWKASPKLQDSAGPGIPLPLPLGNDPVTLRYNVPQSQCPNVTKLKLTTEGDRPTQVRTSTLNTTDGGNDGMTVSDQASPLGDQGEGLAAHAPPRFIVPEPQGNAQAGRTINEAALRLSERVQPRVFRHDLSFPLTGSPARWSRAWHP